MSAILDFFRLFFYRQYVAKLQDISSESRIIDLVHILKCNSIFFINFVMVPFFISAILDFAFRFFVSYFHLLEHECITITSKMIDFVLILLK